MSFYIRGNHYFCLRCVEMFRCLVHSWKHFSSLLLINWLRFSNFQGGLKAVVWTDLFQSCIMLSTLIAVIVKAIQLTGDFEEVWRINVAMGRVEWVNWDPSPFVRNTSLGIFFGQFFLWAAIFSSHQTQVQRYCATKSLRQARMYVYNLNKFVVYLSFVH